jgi:alpha-glucosidase
MKSLGEMKNWRWFALSIVAAFIVERPPSAVAVQVLSPDGNVVIDVAMQSGGIPAYQVTYKGDPIVLESRLGLGSNYVDGFQIDGTSTIAHGGQWINDFGERRVVPDNYNELHVDMTHVSGTKMRLTFRAYDEGTALRYTFLDQDQQQFTYSGERTEFRFPSNTFGWAEYGTENVYQRVSTSSMQAFGERPLTLEYASGKFAALAEAANDNYPRMLLSPLTGVPGALVSVLGGTSMQFESGGTNDPSVTLQAGDSTPWRMFVVGERPGDLLERNYLMLNLNTPSAVSDTTWIQPGKAMRDTQRTTANSKAIIDAAATAGLQYVHLDAGWYQAGNPALPISQLDIHEVIQYGASKDVGVIVYVDRNAMMAQRDTILPLYEQWGIKGVKIGFVAVGSQAQNAWITETLARAAEHHIMLNIHDAYRATGNVRTYPNLMTVEGIRGNEQFPTPAQNATLPFTRYVAGPGDYTVCYYDSRIKGTHAHQLAMGVVSFSPLQWIYWYDVPSEFNNEPELEFFRELPTVWDDTKVVNGSISEYATIARQSGDDWFIGTINNQVARTLQIPLEFLSEGADYLAHIYSDDNSVPTATDVRVTRMLVDSSTTLSAPLVSGGGQAVWIERVLVGDYNVDGVVDAVDYTVWRNSLNQTGTALAADGDYDDVVDNDDYDVWRANYGRTWDMGQGSFEVQPVPEPDSRLLALIVQGLLLASHRMNRPIGQRD